MLKPFLHLPTAIDRLIVTADHHPAGARCVLLLVGLGCVGVGLGALYAALLVRSAVALAGG